MLMIAIPTADMPALKGGGHKCMINGEPTLLRWEDGYLIYKDGEGMENRCRVLMAEEIGDKIQLHAASHGMENDKHVVLAPDDKGNVADVLNPDPAPRYWIAINGSSCALSITPMRNATTNPVAEQMWGFPTLEEAQKAQRVVLNKPMPHVMKYLQSLGPAIKSGRVLYKRPANPDPPTTGQTMWMEAPTTPDEKEIAQIARRAWADAEDGGILPGLPGGPSLKH